MRCAGQGRRQLEKFEGPVDAIIGFWDFPVSSMVPILCQRFGKLCCASLEAVVKYEHKYWSRLERQKVIDEYPRFGLVDPERDTDPPEGMSFPMWIKPVKRPHPTLPSGWTISRNSGIRWPGFETASAGLGPVRDRPRIS